MKIYNLPFTTKKKRKKNGKFLPLVVALEISYGNALKESGSPFNWYRLRLLWLRGVSGFPKVGCMWLFSVHIAAWSSNCSPWRCVAVCLEEFSSMVRPNGSPHRRKFPLGTWWPRGWHPLFLPCPPEWREVPFYVRTLLLIIRILPSSIT